MKKFILIFCFFLMKYCSPAFTQVIDSFVNACYENSEFNGTVLVAKHGIIVLKKGYGYSNAERQLPNDANTIFNIASLTKSFTAVVIMKLQEAGKLSVHDKLSKYYPGFPDANKITIHHLLTHTSGIPDYLQDQEFKKLDQTKAQTLRQMIAFFKDKPLNFEPGARFQYSNSGYTLLGYIIEEVTAEPYANALEQLIFKPLKLQHTSYGPQDDKHLAVGYGMYYKNFKRPAPPVHPSISYATGAIYSTVDDLYAFHNALLTGKFLSKASLTAMYNKDKGPYGYGWFTDSLYGHQRISHDGNIHGFKANINRFPQDGLVVIALSNANNSGVGGMVRNIINLVYHKPFPPAFATLQVMNMPDSAKKEYAGLYRYNESAGAVVEVVLKDSLLQMTVPGSPTVTLDPIQRSVFRDGTMRVEFMRNEKGGIQNLLMTNKGEFLGAGKVK